MEIVHLVDEGVALLQVGPAVYDLELALQLLDLGIKVLLLLHDILLNDSPLLDVPLVGVLTVLV